MLRFLSMLVWSLFMPLIGSCHYPNKLLQDGWEALTKDNDSVAIRLFEQAYETGLNQQNLELKAHALLYLGFASYGTSLRNGLNYCIAASEAFKNLEKESPNKAREGHARCLQLMSTINTRQGKFSESLIQSHEALQAFSTKQDTTGTLILIYNSLGYIYEKLNQIDSAEYYYQLGLKEAVRSNYISYLPNAYIKMAKCLLKQHKQIESYQCYQQALVIADSSDNKQAQVGTWLGLANWYINDRNELEATHCFEKAKQIATELTDKSFYLNVLEEFAALKKKQGKYQDVIRMQDEASAMKSKLESLEKQRIVKSLEVQFDVMEKDRKIKLIQKENEVSRLRIVFLLSILTLFSFITAGVIIFLRRINKRDKQLLKAEEELRLVNDEKKRLKEQQLQNEIEYKESQLTALALQMSQRNELLFELKEKHEQESTTLKDSGIGKILNKAMNQDKDWTDFNLQFESMNKSFYSRIKKEYPDISVNDLKICALIKLNLSIKEMAGILNISPDSVKTARYRLRKKLDLNTEDNLTDFILKI